MYSQQKSPTPSTTAVAPELRTAKRSPASPCTNVRPPVAPNRAKLPISTLPPGSALPPPGVRTMIRPPLWDLATPSLAVPVWLSSRPSLQNAPYDWPAVPVLVTRTEPSARNLPAPVVGEHRRRPVQLRRRRRRVVEQPFEVDRQLAADGLVVVAQPDPVDLDRGLPRLEQARRDLLQHGVVEGEVGLQVDRVGRRSAPAPGSASRARRARRRWPGGPAAGADRSGRGPRPASAARAWPGSPARRGRCSAGTGRAPAGHRRTPRGWW